MINTDDIKRGFLFIVGITGFYIFFSVILSYIDLYFLKEFNAQIVTFLLNFFGLNAELQLLTEPTIIISGIRAQINNLCAGDLEIALITSIILATWDRSWKRRAYGILGGLVAILILNPLRIFIVLVAGAVFNWGVSEFVHDFLFRIMLLLIIAVYYYIWYVRYDDVKKWIKKRI